MALPCNGWMTDKASALRAARYAPKGYVTTFSGADAGRSNEEPPTAQPARTADAVPLARIREILSAIPALLLATRQSRTYVGSTLSTRMLRTFARRETNVRLPKLQAYGAACLSAAATPRRIVHGNSAGKVHPDGTFCQISGVRQEGTSGFEMVSAKMIAMDSTKGKFMGWKHLWATVPLVGVIVLNGCGEHLVAPSPVSEAKTNVAGPDRSATKTMSLQFARSFSDAKYVKIFNNLAQRPSGKYWGESTIVIVGGGASSTFPDNQLAGAFTPSANHTATVIEAAIVNPVIAGGYGSAGFTLSVNQDAKGVPGKALISASLPGLPSNGLGWCCAMVIGKIPSGLALSGGKQYWLVLNGQGAQSTDAAGWDMNATDQVHPFLDAVYCAYASKCSSGPGWYPVHIDFYGTGAAFAVLGSN